MKFIDKSEKTILEFCRKLDVEYERTEGTFVDMMGKQHKVEDTVHYHFPKFIDTQVYTDTETFDVRKEWLAAKNHYGCGLIDNLTFDECIATIDKATKVKESFHQIMFMAGILPYTYTKKIENKLYQMEYSITALLKELQTLRKQVQYIHEQELQ